jgi:hypothetical protein
MPAALLALSGAGAAQRRVTIASILAVRGVSVSRHERLDVKNAGTWHEMAISNPGYSVLFEGNQGGFSLLDYEEKT